MLEIYNKDEFHKVVGEIYKITNTVNNKCYIGQTRSHRLNHDKYRPFGYLGRFKQHISSARSNTTDHCSYLNASLRKYGSEKFTCELIQTCNIDELDTYECMNIINHSSKYPNGYNLTNGGQKAGSKHGTKIVFHEPNPVQYDREKLSLKKSDYTKQLISERVKFAKKDVTHREMQMKHTQNQHQKQKFDRYRHVTVDINNIEQYIFVRCNNICVKIQGILSRFVGKYETILETKKRAIQFINDLIQWQHDQIAGNSLETSQTTLLLETTDRGTRVMTDPNGKTGEVLDNPQPSP